MEPAAATELPAAQFNLFPTVEEQIENITQAQAEERQTAQQHTPTPAGLVPSAVIGRALTSGGNEAHSIEHIVSFFQKGPTGSAAATFMAKEFGEGGKGVKIAGQDYALWFDNGGFRIAPGRSAFGPGSTLITWVNAAAMTSNLLRDGMFAAQEKIDAASENEVRELAEKLWYLRQDFSDSAKEQNLLPTVSQHYFGKGFPDDTKEIAELLKDPVHRQQIIRELAVFVDQYRFFPDLLRFRKIHDPQKLSNDIYYLSSAKEPYQAVEGFAPAKASFITEDEIKQLLMRGGNISEAKLRIYAYFKQGHDAKECAAFLRREYGEGGYTHGGYNENHGSKGIQFTRSDEESGYKGYDTIRLNWNQVQKRVRNLIESDQYLTLSEKNFLPEYENRELARRICGFYRIDPNRTNPPGDDLDAAEKKIYAILTADDSEKESGLFHEMFNIMATVPPDSREYQLMAPVLRDMEAVTRDEYSLYAPLPEAVLQAERQAKQAAKEAKRAPAAPKRTPAKVTDAPEGELAAAARALAQKMKPDVGENEDGQFNLFSMTPPAVQKLEPSTPQPAEPEEPPAPKKYTVVETILSPDLEAERQRQMEAEKQEAAARYDLGYGHLGNGLTVWNRLEEEHGDYKTVAHIAPDRAVTFYDKDMPEVLKAEIRKVAMTTEMSVSTTQDTPVFSTPPQVPEQEHAPDAAYFDGYKAVKEANPDGIVLYQVGDFYEIYGEDAKNAAAILGLNLTTKHGIAGSVDMCGFPVRNLDEQLLNRLRASHAVTITLYDVDREKHMAYTMQAINTSAKESPEVPAPQPETAFGDHPTIRQIYEHYVPIIQDLVLKDQAFQNACVNSDKESAYLEGGEAVLRAVRTIEDPTFLHLYFGNTTFHTRLFRDIVDNAYPVLSNPQQKREQVQGIDDPDTIPNNFELQYRQLSRLKSDCEYFLGAGGRAAKHLSEGGIEAQIAKMRELYDLLLEKPEWLTAEDIDRYEAQMQAGAVVTTVPNYEATVTAEEAPLLSRLLATRGIDTAQFVHDNGDVTFSFAAAVRETVEHLIAKLRAEISKAVEAATKPKKAGRTRPELNYRAFGRLFPEIASGEYRYLRLESGPSMMPLHVSWIDKDVISVSHTTLLNGDVMYDPEMTFRVDREKGTLEALTFQQDGFPQRYQEVYPEPGMWRPKLRNSLNSFAQQWFKNISQQNYHKREAIMVRDDEDVNLTFDKNGKPVEVVTDISPEPAPPEMEAPVARDPLAPAYQVGDTVYVRDKAFVIAKVEESRVLLQDPAHDLPIYESMGRDAFARALLEDPRNQSITDFLSA